MQNGESCLHERACLRENAFGGYATATKCFAFWSWRGSDYLLWHFMQNCESCLHERTGLRENAFGGYATATKCFAFWSCVALITYYGISNAYATAAKCFAFWSCVALITLLWHFKCIRHSDKRKTRLTLSHESGLLKCRLGSMYIFYYSCFNSRKRVTEFIRT